MNKVLLVGRLVRDPDTNSTQSSIKYTRFTIAITRPFGEDQVDFVPIVAWRNQAEFVERYMRKGSLVSVEGRFTSSTYQNNENMKVTRYEVTADRVEALETKAQVEARNNSNTNYVPPQKSATATQVMQFEKDNQPEEDQNDDVPWELDL